MASKPTASTPATQKIKRDKVDVKTRVCNAATGASVPVVPGLEVVHENQLQKIVAVTHQHAYVHDAVTGDSKVLRHGEYELPKPKELEARLLSETSEAQKERAQEIQKILGPLAELSRNLISGELDTACREVGLGEKMVRTYLGRLKMLNHWTSCLPEKRGPRKGTRYTKGARLGVLDHIVAIELKKEEGITETSIINAVNDALRSAGLKILDHMTIRNYIRSSCSVDLRLRRRLSGKVEQEALRPCGDGLSAEYPLQKIQIDSTPADVMVVDSQGNLIGRPWITFVIDVFSRVVLGIYISMDAPSAISTGSAIVDALFPKRRRLINLNLANLNWPCYGKFEAVTGLDHGCEHDNRAIAHGIKMMGLPEPQWRTDVRDGAIIERLIGTFVGKMHMLPGTTWSNPKHRGNYRSDFTAVLGVGEFERWMVTQVVEYLHTPHRGLDQLTPVQVWHQGWEASSLKTPPLIQNERETRVSFLPFKFATATREGLQLNGETYRDTTINDLIRRHARVQVHYDPRDLSRVWVRNPFNNKLIEVPWKDRNKHPYSLVFRKAWRTSNRRLGRSPEMQQMAQEARSAGRDIIMKATENTRRRERDKDTSEKTRHKQAKQDLGSKTPPNPAQVETNGDAPNNKVDWSAPPKRYRTWSR